MTEAPSIEEIIDNLFITYKGNFRSVVSALNWSEYLQELLTQQTSYLPAFASIGQRLYHVKRREKIGGRCAICSADTGFKSFHLGYRKYCSNKCNFAYARQQAIKKYGTHPMKVATLRTKVTETCLKRYGGSAPAKSSAVREKMRTTFLNKYGVDNPFKADCVKKKIEAINLERYGDRYPIRTEEIKKKFKGNCLAKYGVTHPNMLESIKEKSRRTCVEKYGKTTYLGYFHQVGEFKKKRKISYFSKLFLTDRLQNKVIPLFSLDEYRGGGKNKYEFKCSRCDTIFVSSLENGKIPRCFKCYPSQSGLNFTSRYEDEVEAWLKLLNIQSIKRNDRILLEGKELDLYLPSHHLALEFNGLWSHSELQGNKDKNYHLNKTLKCKEKGIQLLHIFEDEWIEKQNIVKSIIRNKLGLIERKIYARECVVKEVDTNTFYSFLFDNHLQEPLSSKHSYGLYTKENELIYLIGLSKPRFTKGYEYELIRSCPRMNTVVVGGFNKLLDHAIEKLDISSIVSYVDKRYFTGEGYKDWTLIGESSPNYFYTKDYLNRESRMKYQKHKIVETEEDKLLTEWQLMQLKGYDRVWDCGSRVYEWKS